MNQTQNIPWGNSLLFERSSPSLAEQTRRTAVCSVTFVRICRGVRTFRFEQLAEERLGTAFAFEIVALEHCMYKDEDW